MADTGHTEYLHTLPQRGHLDAHFNLEIYGSFKSKNLV